MTELTTYRNHHLQTGVNQFYFSYCGLACVEIKGHSKSVGYEPGMKIREDTFQNTWNAVLIDGDWWPVQCNWGAR